MAEPSNTEVCEAFRKLLAESFYVVTPDGEIVVGDGHDATLLATKPWRSELWKAFHEIEDRLCPNKRQERLNRAKET